MKSGGEGAPLSPILENRKNFEKVNREMQKSLKFFSSQFFEVLVE